MKLKAFLDYVEIRTKIASMFPFVFGTLYASWAFHRFDFVNMLLMLVALLSIDMATTASNNYTDCLKAVHREGYNYAVHNVIVRDNINLRTAFNTIAVLVATGIGMGLVLSARTGWLVLFLGALSFAVGLLYSWGPFPISRTPLGEAVSGFMMGFLILFLSVYIHGPGALWVSAMFQSPWLILRVDPVAIARMFLISVPMMVGISNIMLCNNICDVEADRIDGRRTLPMLLGIPWSLRLSAVLLMGMYAGVLSGIVLSWLPWETAVVVFSIPVVFVNYRRFASNQEKAITFVLAVKSYSLMAALYCAGLAMSMFIS